MVKIQKAFPLGFTGLLLFSLIFALLSCFSPYMGDEGTLTINLGSSSRSAIPWPPDDPGVNILDKIDYEITLTGNGRTIPITAKGSESIRATVSVGWWNVNVKAYYPDKNTLYAEGNNSVEVRSGRSNFVAVPMGKTFFNLGDIGPGGGIIFYVNRAGFTVQGYGNPGDPGYFASYTANYLEVATVNAAANLPWSVSLGFISDVTAYQFPANVVTSDMGNGRKDTQIIIAARGLADNYAARSAAEFTTGSGHEDWFLPSAAEFILLYQQWDTTGRPTNYNITGSYWTSSQSSNLNNNAASFQILPTTGIGSIYLSSQKTSPAQVRAIRAF